MRIDFQIPSNFNLHSEISEFIKFFLTIVSSTFVSVFNSDFGVTEVFSHIFENFPFCQGKPGNEGKFRELCWSEK